MQVKEKGLKRYNVLSHLLKDVSITSLQTPTSYYWKLLWYDARRGINASGQVKETPRPSLYPPLGAGHQQTSFQDPHSEEKWNTD